MKLEIVINALNKLGIREILILFTLFFVYNNFMHKKEVIINADGRGYYEYLPAIFIYNDIHYGYLDTLSSDYYSVDQMSGFYRNPMFAHRVNKYFSGTALLQSPFFAAGHFYTENLQDEFKADGFSKPYQRAILYAAVFYLFLGLIFIRKLLSSYKLNGWWIFIVQLALLYCTSLFTYTMYDPAYSHVYSFFLISGFLLAVRSFLMTQKTSSIFWMFVLLGLIVIVRPVNILVLLFIPFLSASWNDFVSRLKSLFVNSWRVVVFGFLLFFGIVCVQLYISYLQTGNPLNYNYGSEGFNFLSPRLFDFLFSYKKGFFLWSPWWALIFIMATIFWLKSKKYYHLISFFIAFIAITYVFSSWSSWSYGGSFGSRPMVDFYAAFALLTVPIYKTGKKIIYGLILLLTLPLGIINLVQTVQYQKAIIHWNGMNKERYWKVFLNTNEKYNWYFWRTPFEVGEKQAEITLFNQLELAPTDHYETKPIPIDIIDRQSKLGQIILDLNREADNEYMVVRMYDSLNNEISYALKRFFIHQWEHEVIYGFNLPNDKMEIDYLTIVFKNVKEPLVIEKATFSTHYSLN